jgi:hypothetical protein
MGPNYGCAYLFFSLLGDVTDRCTQFVLDPTTGVVTVNWVNTDSSMPTTSLFVMNGRLILTGYNGAISGSQKAVRTLRLISFVIAADHG